MNRIILLFIVLLLQDQTLQAQSETKIDTLQGELEDIVVVGYEGNRSLMETPGAVSNIKAARISGFDESSIVYGLNAVPGVRIEQRAPGSYRVAIRGSSLRAPFGVRNVKIYWNDIPFTEPSGSTPLNLLDVINMQEAEIIKGPAGSIYGAGNGGVILFNSRQSNASRVGVGAMVGFYGMSRYTAFAEQQTERANVRFNYSNQSSDGYREQSFLERQTAELSTRFQINDKQIIKTSFLYSDLYYGIPGGLTLQQYQNDPSQARPGNQFVLGSVEANASIDQQAFLAGISHDVELTEKFSNLTTLYGNFSAFENPFNLDYKKDSRKSGGGRTRFYLDTAIGDVKARFAFGGEYQAANYAARNYENTGGATGALNFDDEIRIQSSLIFFNTELDLPADFFLTAGLSYNRLNYNLNRLVTNLQDDVPGVAEKSFDPEIIPRVGLVKRFSEELSIHSSISYGFSPPTIEEFRTNEGSIALDLEAEQGTNYELGFRGNINGARFSYDISGFLFKLSETIVQQPSDRNSTVVFENTGATDQYGIEVATSWRIIQNKGRIIEGLNWDLSYSYHDFSFVDYQKEGEDYSGNDLTGVAPHTFNSSWQMDSSVGLYLNLNYNFTDEIPLNDSNSVYSDAYHLLQSRLGYRVTIFETMALDAYVGVDNLLDETYSLGNDLNAFGDRFYQPAAPRNWFGGLKVSVDL